MQRRLCRYLCMWCDVDSKGTMPLIDDVELCFKDLIGGEESVPPDRLVGLVVKVSTSRADDPGFESRLRWDFFGGQVIPVT